MKIYLCLLVFLIGCAGEIKTPLEEKNYTAYTRSHELKKYLHRVAGKSGKIGIVDSLSTLAGNNLYLLKLEVDNKIEDKLKVLIFAQQHGNEHSGKEASLLILKKVIENELDNILENIIIYLIPQVNPDGSDKDVRLNSNKKDLNRDHLLLSERESRFINNIFFKYFPHAVLDIHEYFPFSNSWMEYGYIKNYDVQFGSVTNPNIADSIFLISDNDFFPFIDTYLKKKNISHHKYIVGGPPNKNRIRYSTADINDGRQKTGIFNTFSFILEGRNGRNSESNLKDRTLSQYEAIMGWLTFLSNRHSVIAKTVNNSRNVPLHHINDSVVIRQEHFPTGIEEKLKLLNPFSNKDTLISQEIHSQVKPTLTVKRPYGYFVKKSDSLIINWLKMNKIDYSVPENMSSYAIMQYQLISINKSIDEELENYYPAVFKKEIKHYRTEDYYLIPCNNVGGNYLVIALEPQSQCGLIQYEEFSHLLNLKTYPILRVERFNE